jgi:hypothetical protein
MELKKIIKKLLVETTGAVCLLIGLLLANTDVKACTQTDMYEAVEEAVRTTYTEASYNFTFSGEDGEVTEDVVENVIEEVTENYSDYYDIDMTDIQECADDADLEGYEVSIDVSNLEYKEQQAFKMKLDKTVNALKKKCKGKSKLKKVGVINKWCKNNIAVKSSATSDIYTVFTTKKGNKQGLAALRAHLLWKVCGYRTKVVKYKKKYCTLVKIGRTAYLIK